MKTRLLIALTLLPTTSFAADAPPKPATPAPAVAPAKPPLKIIPGKVIVPTDTMRRPWGELISIDPATRTGKFRKDGSDEVMPFTILPYAELLHHAAFGDVEDFRPGERVIFRLHPNDAGEWTWLTYIQDEMNMMLGHKEYFHVTAVDPAKGTITADWASADKSFVRTKDLVLETDKETRFWKNGAPAKLTDVKVGDPLRTKTHGIGKDAHRVCWEVFLDDASLLKFQAEQKSVHTKRLAERGAPGYVDSVTGGTTVALTMFQESGEVVKGLKAGSKVRLAVCGPDRLAAGPQVTGVVTTAKAVGKLGAVTLTLDAPAAANMTPGAVVRLWIGQ